MAVHSNPMPYEQDIAARMASHPNLNEKIDLMEHHLACLDWWIAELRKSLLA